MSESRVYIDKKTAHFVYWDATVSGLEERISIGLYDARAPYLENL